MEKQKLSHLHILLIAHVLIITIEKNVKAKQALAL